MKFDLHVHSSRSHDSRASIRTIVEHARKRGLAGFAITDHGLPPPQGLEELAAESCIWIIRGSEIRTEIGDIIGLFISKPIKSSKAEGVIGEIHDQGGVAVLAHPFKYARSYPSPALEGIDAIEIVNARWKDLGRFNGKDEVNRILSLVKGRSAGSDAHFAFEVGGAYWETAPVASEEDLKQSIRSGSGRAVCSGYSRWLDEASQGIKFMKQPSARQLARVLYRTIRRLAFMPRGGL
jgi:predicted metal-dependent phosphoesterase TrpH